MTSACCQTIAFDEQSGERLYPPLSESNEPLPLTWDNFLEWYRIEQGQDACPLYDIVDASDPVLLVVCHEESRIVCHRLPAQRLRHIIARFESSRMTDPLTGALRKEYAEEVVETALSSYVRDGVPFCLMFIDLDHFKKVNDTYGHITGDNVLGATATHIREMLRGDDILIRYGGEEFLAVIKTASLPIALKVAQRVLESIRETPIESDGNAIALTVSIGITTPERSDTVLSMIERADNAVYKAKTHGRNRIEYL